MTVSFEGNEEQAVTTLWYMQTQRKNHATQFRTMRSIGWFLIVGSVIMLLFTILNSSGIAAVLALLYGAMGFVFIRQEQIQHKAIRQVVQSGGAQTVFGPQEYTLTPYGIRHKSRYFDGILPWSGITKIEATETQLAFHLSEMQAFLIPKSAFTNETQWMTFLQQAQQYRLQDAQQKPATPQASQGGWWTQGTAAIDDERQSNTLRQ